VELTSLLTIRTYDSHATPVNEFLLFQKLHNQKIGYTRTGKVLRVLSY